MAESKSPQVMRALLRNAPISPRKMRLASGLVAGLKVQEALDRLEFTPRKSARILRKVLDSAISNAENNHGADIDELIVSLIRVDKGLVLSRFRARARGRYGVIEKPRCNIEVRVGTEIDPGRPVRPRQSKKSAKSAKAKAKAAAPVKAAAESSAKEE